MKSLDSVSGPVRCTRGTRSAALLNQCLLINPCRSGAKRLRNGPIAMAVAAALYFEFPPPVHAAGEPTALQEVVVSATRREESIQNTPYNIAAVSSELIDELHLTKIDDVSHWVPGVSVQNQGAFGASDVVVRGLNVSETGASGGGPNGAGGAVAEYLGELPFFFDFKLLDIDRVEVLLGPQGTLYGTGTLGGVIRYIPKKPNLTNFAADAHVRLTDISRSPQPGYDSDLAFNVPLIEGKLGLRAVVGYFRDAGYIDFTRLVKVPGVSNSNVDISDPQAVAANLRTEKGVDFDHTLTARLTLLYQPNDVLEAQLMAGHQRTSTDGTEGTQSPLLGTGRYEFAGRLLQPSERKVDIGSLVLTGHFGFADLVSATSYGSRRIQQRFDTTDGYLSYAYANFPAFVSFDVSEENRDQYSEELRLVSAGQSRFKWIAGVFYEHFNDYFVDHEYMPGYPAFAGIDRPDELDYYSRLKQRFTDRAAFGELGYRFTPAWQVTVGMRWFIDHMSSSQDTATPFVDGSPPNGLNLASLTTSGLPTRSSIYKLNSSYRFTDDLMLYATVSDGYRAGGINTEAACTASVTVHCLPPSEIAWKPDRTRNYETGVRSTWFDKHLTLNGAVYYIRWKDLRVQAIDRFNQAFLTNGPRAVSQGVEMQFQALLPAHLRLMGNYTYNDARMADKASRLLADNFGHYDAQPGDRLPGSPQQMAGLHIQYSRRLPGDYECSVAYGISAQSNIYSKIGLRASGEKIPGYAVSDMSLNLSKARWSGSFFVDNIFDRYAFTGVEGDLSYLSSPTVNGLTYRSYFHSVLRPRQFGLEFRTSFGP